MWVYSNALASGRINKKVLIEGLKSSVVITIVYDNRKCFQTGITKVSSADKYNNECNQLKYQGKYIDFSLKKHY